MAARLSEDPEIDVVLIEQGSFPGSFPAPGPPGRPAMDPRPIWSLAEAFDPRTSGRWYARTGVGRDLELVTGRTVGGSGRINGGYFIRPTRDDLVAWQGLIGRDDWVDRMLAGMIRCETDLDLGGSPIHGDRGPIRVSRDVDDLHPVSEAFLDAASDLGIERHDDHNDGAPVGIGPVPLNSSDGYLVDPAVAYLLPAAHRPNLSVLTNRRVSRVVTEGLRAVGVETTAGTRTESIGADEVILSAGTIGSVALLFASGVGDAARLRANGIEPLVHAARLGRHYWNHPFVDLHFTPGSEPGPQRSERRSFMQLVAHTSTSTAGSVNAEFMATRRPYGVVSGTDPSDRTLSMRVTLLDAGAGGSIRPTPGGVEVGDDHLGSIRDRKALGDAIRFASEMLATAAFRAVGPRRTVPVPGIRSSDAELADFVSARLGVSYHMIGSCPMGPDPETSVVDPRFRVHGIEDLWVVDGSVVPLQISRGPAAAVIGLAEVAADEFIEQMSTRGPGPA